MENVWVNPSLRMGMILTHLPMTLDGLYQLQITPGTQSTVTLVVGN